MTLDDAERREHRRYQIDVKVRMRVRSSVPTDSNSGGGGADGSDDLGDFYEVTLENISVGGMFAHSPRLLETDQDLEIQILLPQMQEPLRIEGWVRRVAESERQVGGHQAICAAGVQFVVVHNLTPDAFAVYLEDLAY
jgi:hypothetical protein